VGLQIPRPSALDDAFVENSAPSPASRTDAYARADRELEALLADRERSGRFLDALERWHRHLLETERETRPEAYPSLEERRERWVCAWKVREIETFREAFDANSPLDGCAPSPHRLPRFRADAQLDGCAPFPHRVQTLTAAAHYAAYAPPIHAETQALELRLALSRLRREARALKKAGAWREEPRGSLEAWERQEHAYWTRYFTVLLTWQHALDRGAQRDCAEPLSAKVPPFVAARMNDFYAAMAHEPAWSNTP
jgi:hypothetical protein